MSVLGSNPWGIAKTLEKSVQIAYKWDESIVDADKECRVNNYMPRYFTQASFTIFIGWSGPDSALLTYREMYTAYIIVPGAYANYI